MSNNTKLKELIAQIPDIRKHFKVVSGGGIPRNIIYTDPEFIAWKNRILVELEKRPSTESIENLRRILSKMSGWRDEVDFEEAVSCVMAIVESEEEFEEVTEEIILKKGTVVFSAFNIFTLVKQVGSGGNGKVWNATDKDGESVALKFLERDNSEKVLKRFKNETFFCMFHKHPNIVPILDYGTAGNNYIFYVMPLYAGTLRDRMKEGIEPEDACKIFTGILNGLNYAHKFGTIHRDIKPENILFKPDSLVPIIADFGIAHFSTDELATIIETKRTDRMANFQYAAPEQRKKGGISIPQTDIYAAGLILNEMFTGEIAQASGYKKISEINPEYSYLDEVFSEIFKQEACERLYPEENIITQMLVLAEKQKNEIEIKRLRTLALELQKPEDYNQKVISVNYENGKLLFDLEQPLIDAWFQIIAYGTYSNTAVMGFEHERLEKYGRNTIAMPMRVDEQQSTIKKVVGYVNEWITSANGIYRNQVIQQLEKEQMEKEQQRLAEIKHLERINDLNNFLSTL